MREIGEEWARFSFFDEEGRRRHTLSCPAALLCVYFGIIAVGLVYVLRRCPCGWTTHTHIHTCTPIRKSACVGVSMSSSSLDGTSSSPHTSRAHNLLRAQDARTHTRSTEGEAAHSTPINTRTHAHTYTCIYYIHIIYIHLSPLGVSECALARVRRPPLFLLLLQLLLLPQSSSTAVVALRARAPVCSLTPRGNTAARRNGCERERET